MSVTRPTAEPGGALVTVILPTHRHASTVDLAGRSVLEQSVSSLELVVIGDGVSAEVRAAVAPLLSDERVRFIDHAKTASRAELVRHDVLVQATSPYVCYLGDDDIMLPGHLALTLDRLESVDFTHPLPVFIDGEGRLQARMTDLADPRCREWHQHPTRNAVSLTGVGHRLNAYRRLPHGWREAPLGSWSDHYMWQQWFAGPEFRYATGDRLTVLKFEGADRTEMSGAERRAEIEAWLQRSRQPGFDAWLADRAIDAIRRAAIDLRLAVDFQADYFAGERDALASRESELRAELVREREAKEQAQDQAATAGAELRAAQAATVEVSARLRAVQASRTWRLRNRLVRFPPLGWLSRG